MLAKRGGGWRGCGVAEGCGSSSGEDGNFNGERGLGNRAWVESESGLDFARRYWTGVTNCDEPPAKLELEGAVCGWIPRI